MFEAIETGRLILRMPRESDTRPLLEIQNTEFVLRYNGMGVTDEEQMLDSIRKNIEHGSAIHIERRSDGALLGGIWLEPDGIRYGVSSKCISYYLGEQYARQGYMKEALAAAVEALFARDPALEVISARVFKGNTASERLLLSLGFAYEGCIRRCVRVNGKLFDDMQFSLLREDVRAQKINGNCTFLKDAL